VTAAAFLALESFYSARNTNRLLADEVLALARTTGAFYAAQHVVLGQAGFAAISAGDWKEAEYWRQRLESDLPALGAGYRNWYHVLSAQLALNAQRIDDAESHRRHAFGYNHPGWAVTDAATLVMSARVLLARNETAAAKYDIDRAITMCETQQSPLATFMARMGLCEVEYRANGRLEPDIVRSAMSLGARHGILNWWSFDRTTVALFCAFALQYGIEPDYAATLVRTHALDPPMQGPRPSQWPYPVRVLALGQFRLLRPDGPVSFSRKVQRRPLALLQSLVALGPRPVREERLMDLLWPDAAGDAARFALTTTLYRLRRMLGCEAAVERRNSTLWLNPLRCWVDVFELRTTLDTLEQRRIDARDVGDAVTHALASYSGPLFGAAYDEPDHRAERDELQRRLLRQVYQFAEELERAGDVEPAIAIYERAFRLAPSSEEGCRLLVASLLSQGSRARASGTFAAHVDALKQQGARPTSRMLLFVRELRLA
jgi:DNA-binding SARP family transcriptional activator